MHPAIKMEPDIERSDDGKRALQTWALPLDEAFLEELLSHVFTAYWDKVVFGPIIEGAAYELTCPSAPTTCRVFDGYLTVSFGGPHFHLCIGETKGHPRSPTPSELAQRRRPSKARIFRRLDVSGAPISWGFEMWNGAGEPMISIFFANPFIETGDRINKVPKWENLAMWRDISQRFLGRPPEAFDESGRGYRGQHG